MPLVFGRPFREPAVEYGARDYVLNVSALLLLDNDRPPGLRLSPDGRRRVYAARVQSAGPSSPHSTSSRA